MKRTIRKITPVVFLLLYFANLITNVVVFGSWQITWFEVVCLLCALISTIVNKEETEDDENNV